METIPDDIIMCPASFMAFTHGIRLVVEAHGGTINDEGLIGPVLEKMDAILASPRNSLVRAHDDCDMEDVQFFRRLERELCEHYLRQVAENQPEPSDG